MYPASQLLVHLCGETDWNRASAIGELRPESLRANGFVHLSTLQQVHLPANRIFAGRTDLVLLFIERDRLEAPLRWEPGVADDPPAMRFPHLYGVVPVAAVVRVEPYRPGPDGRFRPVIPNPALEGGQT